MNPFAFLSVAVNHVIGEIAAMNQDLGDWLMKKIILAAALTAAMSAPAFAASMTVSFAGDDGTTQVWTLGDDGKATAPDGSVVDYTYDEATRTLCAQVPDAGEVCATFESAGEGVVGETSRYTTSAGTAGTATVTAVSE